jgi:AcrR family transcriptional regulator
MIIAEKQVSVGKDDRIPPRERILAVAMELFYRHGIRAVGVEAIAEAAGTNKMTLYRHFVSKDELVAEYLRRLAGRASASWDRRAAHVGSGDQRGCALANAAVELPEKDHPARRVIETFKTAQRQRIIDLCAAAKLDSPEMLADELFLLLEGARVTAQSIGRDGLGDRLMRMGEAMIAAHEK